VLNKVPLQIKANDMNYCFSKMPNTQRQRQHSDSDSNVSEELLQHDVKPMTKNFVCLLPFEAIEMGVIHP
jgi:hypothetical protein